MYATTSKTISEFRTICRDSILILELTNDKKAVCGVCSLSTHNIKVVLCKDLVCKTVWVLNSGENERMQYVMHKNTDKQIVKAIGGKDIHTLKYPVKTHTAPQKFKLEGHLSSSSRARHINIITAFSCWVTLKLFSFLLT